MNTPDQAPPLALVVDDEPINRLLVADMLSDHGLTCDEAEDGPSGLAKVRAGHYSLVFLDLSMPGMDGMSVCKAIKAEPALAGTFLVAYTAHAFDEQQQEYRRAGFDAVLTKPVSVEGVAQIVGECIARG